MQVCNPQEIRQAHSQNPQNSRESLEKPLSLTWLRTINSKVTVTLRFTEALMLHCFLKKTVHLQGFWPKTVYLKCFGIQLKTVYLQGPCSSRPCISRPCCNLILSKIYISNLSTFVSYCIGWPWLLVCNLHCAHPSLANAIISRSNTLAKSNQKLNYNGLTFPNKIFQAMTKFCPTVKYTNLFEIFVILYLWLDFCFSVHFRENSLK